MGRVNLTNCAAHPDVVVTAACDVDENRLESTVEQYKATCRGFRDYREMLQSKDLDAVIIATLPHWHALQAIAACEAGKDLYIQKPMTLHLAESLAVRNAVRKHNCISQVGTQHHAREEHRRVIEYVRSGNLGPIGVARTFNVMNQAPDGIVGLETALALTLTCLVKPGHLTLQRALELWTDEPRRLFGLRPVRLEPGDPADLVLIDPDAGWTVDPEHFHSKGRNTPFAGWRLTGRALATVCGGRLTHVDPAVGVARARRGAAAAPSTA